ncbi:MAG: hypothetical protein WDM87_10365 [Terracidiphilus sp.]
MRQIDVIPVEDVIEISLELKVFSQRTLEHGAEYPVPGTCFMATLVTT